MFNVRLAVDHLYGKWLFHMAVAGDVFDGVMFCAVLLPHEMSWMRSGIELSQFLRIFLPTFFQRHRKIWLVGCFGA